MSDGGGGNGNNNNKGGRNRRRGRGGGQQPRRTDLWRPVPPLDPPDPIVPASDPAIVLRSLGELPLQGQGGVGQHYVAAVVERAAGLAVALAATADLLASGDDEQVEASADERSDEEE